MSHWQTSVVKVYNLYVCAISLNSCIMLTLKIVVTLWERVQTFEHKQTLLMCMSAIFVWLCLSLDIACITYFSSTNQIKKKRTIGLWMFIKIKWNQTNSICLTNLDFKLYFWTAECISHKAQACAVRTKQQSNGFWCILHIGIQYTQQYAVCMNIIIFKNSWPWPLCRSKMKCMNAFMSQSHVLMCDISLSSFYTRQTCIHITKHSPREWWMINGTIIIMKKNKNPFHIFKSKRIYRYIL